MIHNRFIVVFFFVCVCVGNHVLCYFFVIIRYSARGGCETYYYDRKLNHYGVGRRSRARGIFKREKWIEITRIRFRYRARTLHSHCVWHDNNIIIIITLLCTFFEPSSHPNPQTMGQKMIYNYYFLIIHGVSLTTIIVIVCVCAFVVPRLFTHKRRCVWTEVDRF